jgi:hypothetical protein
MFSLMAFKIYDSSGQVRFYILPHLVKAMIHNMAGYAGRLVFILLFVYHFAHERVHVASCDAVITLSGVFFCHSLSVNDILKNLSLLKANCVCTCFTKSKNDK